MHVEVGDFPSDLHVIDRCLYSPVYDAYVYSMCWSIFMHGMMFLLCLSTSTLCTSRYFIKRNTKSWTQSQNCSTSIRRR